jgi:hypothetical protein
MPGLHPAREAFFSLASYFRAKNSLCLARGENKAKTYVEQCVKKAHDFFTTPCSGGVQFPKIL